MPKRSDDSHRPQEQPVEIDNVKITHPSKLLYSDSGISKLDVAKYYQKVSKFLIPHLIGRPMSLVRTPDGIAGQRFFQKHPTDNFPEYIERVDIKEKLKTGEYILIDNLNDILYLINLGTLEFHTWNSRVEDLEHPDRIVFDLDPAPDAPFETVVDGCFMIKDILDELGLKSAVKTSGNKGYHIHARLEQKMSWDYAKEISKKVADMLATKDPNRFTTTLSKEKRIGKVFIDYLRNDRGSTTVSAFSTRAKSGAGISMPIHWDSVGKIGPHDITILNFERYLREAEDSWADFTDI